MKFSKQKMIKRLTKEGRANLIDDEIISIMDKLDMQPVTTYCWANQVRGENVGLCCGEEVNLDDCVID